MTRVCVLQRSVVFVTGAGVSDWTSTAGAVGQNVRHMDLMNVRDEKFYSNPLADHYFNCCANVFVVYDGFAQT